MKSLLTILGTTVLGSTVASPLINQSTDDQNYSNYEIYWDDNHREIEIVANWSSSEVKFFKYSYNLGHVDMSNFRTISAIDPNNTSYTRSSWANTAYNGKAFRSIENWSMQGIVTNHKIVDNADIANYSGIELLRVEDSSWLATFASSQLLGFSYYQENGDTYFQMFGYQSVTVANNSSGGAMWMNLGQGLRLQS